MTNGTTNYPGDKTGLPGTTSPRRRMSSANARGEGSYDPTMYDDDGHWRAIGPCTGKRGGHVGAAFDRSECSFG